MPGFGLSNCCKGDKCITFMNLHSSEMSKKRTIERKKMEKKERGKEEREKRRKKG